MTNSYDVTVRCNQLERTIRVQATTTQMAEWMAVHAFEWVFSVKATDHDMATRVIR